MKPLSNKDLLVPVFSLFTSMGTLICCALPALLVTLGMGAVLAGLVSAIPQLIWLSTHKEIVFAVAGGLMALSGWVQWRNRRAPCPADPVKARACKRLRQVGVLMYGFSLVLFAIGAFFAFLAPLVL